jgi:hypothetical protein
VVVVANLGILLVVPGPTTPTTVDQTLSLLKNLFEASTPSIADKSNVPMLAFPVAEVLVVPVMYVPKALLKESTPVLAIVIAPV